MYAGFSLCSVCVCCLSFNVYCARLVCVVSVKRCVLCFALRTMCVNMLVCLSVPVCVWQPLSRVFCSARFVRCFQSVARPSVPLLCFGLFPPLTLVRRFDLLVCVCVCLFLSLYVYVCVSLRLSSMYTCRFNLLSFQCMAQPICAKPKLPLFSLFLFSVPYVACLSLFVHCYLCVCVCVCVCLCLRQSSFLLCL